MLLKSNNEILNLLLIEDDQVDVMNVQRAFKKNNIENPLFIAGNGVDALTLLHSNKITPLPKIIILDINMPKMNGIEFLKEIRNDPELKSLSVYIMTTSSYDSDIIEAHKLNVAGYILKPLSFEKFTEVIKHLSDYWALNQFA